jgi:indolepyruvate ferredoxin oxidoreductase
MPGGVQEYLDLGLHGFAMSRYSGCWVGFKCVADTVESLGFGDVDPARVRSCIPDDFTLPPGGLNIRWPDGPWSRKRGCTTTRSTRRSPTRAPTADFKIVIDSPKARLGIIAAGKSYLDTMQALERPRHRRADAADIGIRVYKVAMTWPLEPQGVRALREGPGGNPRGRGEAPAHRVPDEGAALQLARRACGRAWSASSTKTASGKAPARRMAAAANGELTAGDVAR